MSVNSTIDKNFNFVETAIVCGYSSALKSYIAFIRLEKNQYFFRGGTIFYTKDPALFPKVASTFVAQNIRCYSTKATESWLNQLKLSDDSFEAIKNIPVVVGTMAMYEYRYFEACYDRNAFGILGCKYYYVVFGVSAGIGYLSTFVKGTVFGKLPNLLYDLSGCIYDPGYTFNLKKIIYDIIEYINIAKIDMEFKSSIKSITSGVEHFAKPFQRRFSSDDKADSNSIIVDYQNSGNNRVKKVVHIPWSDMYGRCRYLDEIYSSASGTLEHADYDFRIEEEFNTEQISKEHCIVPCFDGSDCKSFLRLFNATRNENVAVPSGDLAALCSAEFSDYVTSTLHGVALTCEISSNL